MFVYDMRILIKKPEFLQFPPYVSGQVFSSSNRSQARTNDVTDLVMSVEKYVVNFPLPYLWHFFYTRFYFVLNVVTCI